MKRVFSAILVLCFLCSAAALAAVEHPHTASDILFRGFPWRSSLTDVIADLTAAGMPDGVITADVTVADVSGPSVYYSEETDIVGLTYSARSSDLGASDGFSVAGHQVMSVEVKAVYGIIDGIVSRKPEDSRIYTAIYYFRVPVDEAAAKAVYDDLFQKMVSLYGEPYFPDDDQAGWTSEGDRTVAYLAYHDYKESPLLLIAYGDATIVDDVAALQESLYASNATNTDGL